MCSFTTVAALPKVSFKPSVGPNIDNKPSEIQGEVTSATIIFEAAMI